jgi:hypothetical protein
MCLQQTKYFSHLWLELVIVAALKRTVFLISAADALGKSWKFG